MLKDRFALLAVGALLLLITVPYVLAFMTAPDGTQFVGSFHDPFDTPVYLSAMRAGARGELLRTLPFTSEPHAAALYYPFYVLLGHIAPPTIITYHLARVVMALLLSFAVGRLLSDVLIEQMEWRVAFVLSILGLGAGWLVVIGGFWTAIRPTDLFAPTSTLFGSAFINPHFPLAAALELLTFSAYLRARRKSYRDGTLLLGALSCFALGWVLPFSLVVVALVLLADVAVESVRSRRLWTPSARAALFILALSGPTVVYYYVLTHAVPFWAELVAQWPPLDHTFTPPEYVAGYGLMLLLAIFGGVFAMSRRGSTTAERFLVVWLVVNGLLIASPLDFSDRTSLAYGVPLGSLSAIALARGIPRLLARWRGPTSLAPCRWLTVLPHAVFLSTLPATLLLVFGHVVTLSRYHDVPFFLPDDDVLALSWLSAHAGPADVVLAAPTLSNQVPARTDARVYSGHTHETFQPQRKQQEISTFFDASTSDASRVDFLRQQNITYVYVKPNSRGMGAFDGRGASYLAPVMSANQVTVYRVSVHQP